MTDLRPLAGLAGLRELYLGHTGVSDLTPLAGLTRLKALYLTAGYPDAESALLLGQTLAAHGADLLEVGVPFSDPIGDGPTIQRSSSLALARGMTVRGALKLAAALAQRTDKPLVLMGYFNPILRYGLDRFWNSCHGRAERGLEVSVLPTFKGVRSAAANFALLPPLDTRPGQYLQHHRQSDGSPGCHAPGS